MGRRPAHRQSCRSGHARAARSPLSSFFIDPASGDETAIDGSAWRPVVDPTDHWAVTWDGTVKLGPDGMTPVPDEGALVLRGFTDERRDD